MPGDNFDRAFATMFGLAIYVVTMVTLLAGGL